MCHSDRIVVVNECVESSLSNPDLILAVVLSASTDPVLRVIDGRVQHHYVPFNEDLSVIDIIHLRSIVRHIAKVDHRPVVLHITNIVFVIVSKTKYPPYAVNYS